jgi:hypothetical protein
MQTSTQQETPMTTDTAASVAADISALLRARNPLLWVVTREEARVERYLFEAAASAGYVARTWDVARGVCDATGRVVNSEVGASPDPGDTLNAIDQRARSDYADRGVWILRDLPAWLQPPTGALQLRQLRNLARFLPGQPRNRAQAIIVLTPVSEVPADLAGHATVIEWPLPDREEIAGILDAATNALPEELKATAITPDSRDAAIDAAVGLTGEEAAACYARSLVQLRKIDPATVSKEKKRVIARERVLEWYDPIPGGLDAVGGFDNLKVWLEQRKLAYSAQARAYGLPAPKGALLVGIPGTGKSLTAKAIATAWGVPLLRVDLGGLKSKFVGESEQNLRKAFKVIESVGRCVVWFDEIEKALAGATQGAADGGVSSDALGGILSWMQERQGESFVIATANDVSQLPPEILRQGRFESLWFLDLPTKQERIDILKTALAAHNRSAVAVDHAKVAATCETFTGAEIAALVPEALFVAFADGAREIETKDLVDVASGIVPLAKTSAEKIGKLREWASQGRARRASLSEDVATVSGARALDL